MAKAESTDPELFQLPGRERKRIHEQAGTHIRFTLGHAVPQIHLFRVFLCRS